MGNTALVMSGGGAKGSFELGAADYLIRDLKIDPNVIVGVSTGNLNAVMLAQGKGVDGLTEQLDALTGIWFGLKENDDVYYERFPGLVAKLLGAIFKADSLYSNKPLWKLIQKHVDPAKLRSSGRILRIGVVGLMSGDFYPVDGSFSLIREMVRASASIPVYFNPVEVGNYKANQTDWFVDGGVRDVTPLGAAFDALNELKNASGQDDVDTIYLILASPLRCEKIVDYNKIDSGIEIMKRSLGLLINEIYRTDLEAALNINAAVKYHRDLKSQNLNLPGGFPFEGYRFANIVVIEPEKEYMDSLDFDPAKIKDAFAAGRDKARGAVQNATQSGGTNITTSMLKTGREVLKTP
jgi:NTE family protein